MGRKKAPIGPCRICGVVGPLTYEHVPPEAAFNDRRIMRATMLEWLRAEGWPARGDQLQRGAGAFTLCGRCNNLTGHWYGTEYVEWATIGFELLDRIPFGVRVATVTFARRKPVRFIKQALTMLFSVNGPGFAERNQDLVRYVMGCASRDFPHRLEISLALIRGRRGRRSGVSSRIDLERGGVATISEVAFPPLAITAEFLLPDSAPFASIGRLTPWARCDLDDVADVTLPVEVGEVATPYPGDLRTADQVARDAGRTC